MFYKHSYSCVTSEIDQSYIGRVVRPSHAGIFCNKANELADGHVIVNESTGVSCHTGLRVERLVKHRGISIRTFDVEIDQSAHDR